MNSKSCSVRMPEMTKRLAIVFLFFCFSIITQSQKASLPVGCLLSPTSLLAGYKFTVSASMKGGNRAFNELQTKGIFQITINRQSGAGIDLSVTDSLQLKLPPAFNIADTVRITSSFAKGAAIVKGSNRIVSTSRIIKLSLPTGIFNSDTVKGINKNVVFEVPVVYTPDGQSLAATPELPFRADVISTGSGQEASIGGNTLTIAVISTSANLYNACSYFPATMQVTSSGFNGGWYKEAAHITLLSSGNTYTYTSSINSLDEIIKDMTIPFDAHPHGVPTYYNYYAKPYVNKKFIGNRPPQGYNYFNFWGVAYETEAGSPSRNTLVVVSEPHQYIFSIQKNKWIEVVNNPIYKTIDGAMFPEAFGTTGDNKTLAVDPSWLQADRSQMAAMPGNGKTFHFWPANGRSYMFSEEGVVDYNDIGGFYATFRGKLILKDPNDIDDRDQSRFIMAAGIDHWKNDGTEKGSEGMGIGRMKYVTDQWQSFNFTTLTESQLRSMPEPLLPDYMLFYVFAKFGNTAYGTVPVRLKMNPAATITTSNPPAVNSGTSVDLGLSVSGLATGSVVKYYSDAAATFELANKVVIPMTGTTYYAQASAPGGCKSVVAPIEVTVNLSTGINDLQDVITRVYPNPVTDWVKIEGISGRLKNVIVTDVSGRKVYELLPSNTSLRANELTIQTSAWDKGIYLFYLTIQPENSFSLTTLTYKVVKQ